MADLSFDRPSMRLETGSRLHFGLFSFQRQPGCDDGKFLRFQSCDVMPAGGFGGVGLMLKAPATELQIQKAASLSVLGDQTGRVAEFVQRWLDYQHRVGWDSLPTKSGDLPLEIRIVRQAPEHQGLGAGTQLALSVARLLDQFLLGHVSDPLSLARSVGRGLRSAVGTHGFYRGGFLVDRGKTGGDQLGILDGAFPFPEAWRVLLIHRQAKEQGIHGHHEVQAFAKLPEIPLEITARLISLARDELVPALVARSFPQFSESIYQYGLTAGHCFTSIQGGPFADDRLQQLVNTLRGCGIAGVGQSSWGPTLFVFLESQQAAENCLNWLQTEVFVEGEYGRITEGRNQGASVCVSEG